MTLSNDPNRRRCRAHSNHGKQCQLAPILGGHVCHKHGGAAPQVKRSAQERLAQMVDPALTALRRLLDEADSDSVRYAAIRDILDRAGYKPKDRVEQTGKVVIEVVYGDPADEGAYLFTAPALGPAEDQE